MITTKIRIAELNIQIEHFYEETRILCRDYLIADDADVAMDLVVTMTEELLSYEQRMSEREYEGSGYTFALGYLETLAVYRVIATYLPSIGGMVFHGAVIALEEEAYLFTAKSGTGKTTHINLWRKQFPNATVVNGDKPIIRIIDGNAYVYGTPWCGKEGWNVNCKKHLRSICILERSATNQIAKESYQNAMPMLMQQAYRPHDPARLCETIDLIHNLKDVVSLYRLGCNMEQEAAVISHNGMNQL